MCPLCGSRKARRGCPALGKQICAVCCGTKRLVQIACPTDCAYLAASREHPPAAAVRRQQHDLSSLVRSMRDLNERQTRVFFLVLTFLARYDGDGSRMDRDQPSSILAPLVDEDVAEASGALAATFETAARGVIYEHRPASLSAERLASALKPLFAEAGQGAGSAFERDAVVVLRRIEEASREAAQTAAGEHRSFLDLVGRIIRKEVNGEAEAGPAAEGPRLIIP